MAHNKAGKNPLPDCTDDESRLGRREFLAVAGVATASVAGRFADPSRVATGSPTTFGYGVEAYGYHGYGGVEAVS